MDINDPELLKYYDTRAPEYEQIYYRDAPQRRQELADEAARLTDLVRDCSVLDLACGTGYWLERMAAAARRITAVDISSEMIAQARQKKLSCPVAFVRADMHDLPFAADSFERITLGFWLSHHPRQHYVRHSSGMSGAKRLNLDDRQQSPCRRSDAQFDRFRLLGQQSDKEKASVR